ncbi:hypothetical protein O6H91_22G022700 [Diphasiastrum complanatum]|uniref:Uncharacterized protein n=1 Tax=Diphasiastrum complanatum TaxID=34168 RepID=A0ACC2ADP2_DIPCM|nr:hypothetical protein O6H91_22G022700 [Diphasiastrum complanatum]
MFGILAFPCNQFEGQERGIIMKLFSLCTRFKVELPMFDKADWIVNGANTAS